MRVSHGLLLIALASVVYKFDHIKNWWNRPAPSLPLEVTPGITVYTANGCVPCADAIALLHRAGLAVTVRNIDTDPAAKESFGRVGGNMPLITDGPHRISGFASELMHDWYIERPRNRIRLDQIGVYRKDSQRLPVLYGTDWCGHCARARQYFAKHGIAYRDWDIERDVEGRRQYQALGLSGVPVIVYEDMVWNGFSDEYMDMKRKWVGDVR